MSYETTTEDGAQVPAAGLDWIAHDSRKPVSVPPKVSQLRQKLGQKAKAEPRFRFYALYDRICRMDVLVTAYALVRHNRGAAGVDGVSFNQLDQVAGSAERLIEELHADLLAKRYRPQAVRRVYIPKSDGGQRPLGIPVIRDRVAQMAALLVLEPIFEADFLECSYGFRPQRNTHQALAAVREHLHQGHREVYDCDLKGYFDTIPHTQLLKCVSQRISDRSVLHLIQMWLEVPMVELPKDRGRNGGSGSRKGTSRLATGTSRSATPPRSRAGTPQGGVISPLLANIYLHWFEKAFYRRDGPHQRYGAHVVRYADDILVFAKNLRPQLVKWIEARLEQDMHLTVNRAKTQIVKLYKFGVVPKPQVHLDFLGYSFRYDRSPRVEGTKYLNVYPSDKALQHERDQLRELISSHRNYVPVRVLVSEVNRHLRGWGAAFSYGYPAVAFSKVNRFLEERLHRHLQRRSQRHYRFDTNLTWRGQLEALGLVYLGAPVPRPARRQLR